MAGWVAGWLVGWRHHGVEFFFWVLFLGLFFGPFLWMGWLVVKEMGMSTFWGWRAFSLRV